MLYRLLFVLLFLFSVSAYSDFEIDKSQLIDFLDNVEKHGLAVDSSDWLDLLEDASDEKIYSIYKKYAGFIDRGRLDKKLFQNSWNINDHYSQASGSYDFKSINELESRIPAYKSLKISLAKLNWWRANAVSIFNDSDILFEGDQSPMVHYLSQWLLDLDLVEEHLGKEYSKGHLEILTKVQLQYKLMPDGRLGGLTRQALLAITNQRITRLKVNLERLRWLPHELPYPHILADIAGYQVLWTPDQKNTVTYRAIFGKPEKQTPIFQGEVESVTLNPIWKVPHTIASSYLLRLEKKSEGRLKEEGFLVYQNWNDNAREVDIDSIDWKKMTVSNFRYRLEQQPGPTNRLGKMKLNMPNEYGIYLHDTNKPELFDIEKRVFSSGCGRVDNVGSMVEAIFLEQKMPAPVIEEQDNYVTSKLPLNKKVPVYFVYFTAWPDEQGRVRFRDDVYALDNALSSWF